VSVLVAPERIWSASFCRPQFTREASKWPKITFSVSLCHAHRGGTVAVAGAADAGGRPLRAAGRLARDLLSPRRWNTAGISADVSDPACPGEIGTPLPLVGADVIAVLAHLLLGISPTPSIVALSRSRVSLV
jgi:hypothetical protein